MKEFTTPVSKFRDVIRNAGDKPLGFTVGGYYLEISSTYGETDLLPCPNNCELQSGWYALVSPREEKQPFVQIIYQCSYCDHMLIRAYDVANMGQYTEKEYIFVDKLINGVLRKRTQGDMLEYTKRKKIDILAS